MSKSSPAAPPAAPPIVASTIAPQPPGATIGEALTRLSHDLDDARKNRGEELPVRRDDLEVIARALDEAEDAALIGPGERLQIANAIAEARIRGGSHAIISKSTLSLILASAPALAAAA